MSAPTWGLSVCKVCGNADKNPTCDPCRARLATLTAELAATRDAKNAYRDANARLAADLERVTRERDAASTRANRLDDACGELMVDNERVLLERNADHAALTASRADLSEAERLLERVSTMHPAAEWHEDHGDVLWWRLPVNEPPFVGSPLDTDWDEEDSAYYTHWTHLPNNDDSIEKWLSLRKART